MMREREAAACTCELAIELLGSSSSGAKRGSSRGGKPRAGGGRIESEYLAHVDQWQAHDIKSKIYCPFGPFCLMTAPCNVE